MHISKQMKLISQILTRKGGHYFLHAASPWEQYQSVYAFQAWHYTAQKHFSFGRTCSDVFFPIKEVVLYEI